MKIKTDLTAEFVRSILDYKPETGEFIWKDSLKFRPQQVGQIAGYIDRRGRRCIKIDHGHYMAHRLAWLIVHGRWPTNVIDHINRDESDNRLANLREASGSQNQANRLLTQKNVHGFRGVSRRGSGGSYIASINRSGKKTYIGSFPTPEDAHAAYRSEFIKLHGEFALLD